MLVLSRESDTTVWIGPNVRIKVLSIQKHRVKLGIEAPEGIRVWRDELMDGSEVAKAIYEESSGGVLREGPNPILVVEDDTDHADLIARILSEACLAAPVIAPTGEAALEYLERAVKQPARISRPRLVVLDLNLPGMSGLEVLRRIRSRAELRTMPVVVLSVEQSDAVVGRCLEAGANAFVSKVGDLDQLRKSVRRLAIFWGGECRIPAGESAKKVRTVRAK
ncbi:MAG: response regulator [Thermoguttaceae bacterium]